MIGKLIAYLIGALLICIGFFYKKKHHEKYGESIGRSTSSTGSIIGDILVSISIFLLGLMPWFLVKIILILLGLILIILVYFY